MHRRRFLRSTLAGAGGLWLAGSTGCAGPPEASSQGAGQPWVGDELFVFGPEGPRFLIEPSTHSVLALDDEGRETSRFGALGDEPGELNFPTNGVLGPDGNLYVLDSGNGRIQVYDGQGQALGNLGDRDDLHAPRDLAFDDQGRLYVVDVKGHAISVFSTDGSQLDHIELGGDHQQGLNGPRALCFDPEGLMHVVDAGGSRVLVLTVEGQLVGEYGGHGTELGEFLRPSSIAIDADGLVYVADPSSGFVTTFAAGGECTGRFQPRGEDGDAVTPVRLRVFSKKRLHIWAAGHRPAPSTN